MRKIHLVVVASIIALIAPLSVMAQSCSSSESDTLRDCIDSGVANCAAATTDCNPLALALTISDVEDIAIEKCCGNAKKGARKSCLIRERLKYFPKPGAGDQKAFFTAARAAINALRTSDCNGNAYSSNF